MLHTSTVSPCDPCRPSAISRDLASFSRVSISREIALGQTGIKTAYRLGLERRFQLIGISGAAGFDVRRRNGRSQRPLAEVLRTVPERCESSA